MRTFCRVAGAVLAVAATSFAGDVPARAAQAGGERITAYAVDVEVRPSGVIRVTETIHYDFGREPRHGIERRIPVRFRHTREHDRVYPVSAVDVSGGPGTPTDLKRSRDGRYEVLRIGDPDRTISGSHRYVLGYDVAGALNRFESHDELYWNAIGDEWDAPIESASVTVRGAGRIGKVACFAGPVGSTLPCAGASADGTTATFRHGRLSDSAAMTVVVALPAGYAREPGPVLDERWTLDRAFARTPTTVGLSGVLLAGSLGAVGRLVWRTGRDRRYAGEIPGLEPPPGAAVVERRAPLFADAAGPIEYTPPEGLRPALVGVLVDESADPLDVTATIVDLAVRRYLHIEELPRKGLFRRRDWRLTRLPAPSPDDLNGWERALLGALFEGKETVEVSDLKNEFHTHLKDIQSRLYDDVVKQGWFTRRPDRERGRWFGVGVAVAAAGAGLTWLLASRTTYGLVGLPVALAGLALLALHHRMPFRTAKGSAALARALGFRRYLATAEREQLRFEEGVGVFARYLPYAVVFGETERWAKAFADLGGDPGRDLYWYSGPAGWDIGDFGDSMGAFSTSTAGTLASTPSSSGSSGFGGGGFSGGGGGGGGGGSW